MVDFFDQALEAADRIEAAEYDDQVEEADQVLVIRALRESLALNTGIRSENEAMKRRLADQRGTEVPLVSIPTRDLLTELLARHGD